MTNKYQFTYANTETIIIAHYKWTKLRRLDISADLKEKQKLALISIIPIKEGDINKLQEQYKGRININLLPKKSQSLHAQFMDTYFRFYYDRLKIEPKITAIDGRAMNSIIAYFKKISDSDKRALTNWQALLSQWDSLSKFYQGQISLKQINSNLNNLINEIKTDNQKSANSHADELRQSI